VSLNHHRNGSGPAILPAGPSGFLFVGMISVDPILPFRGLAAPAAP